MIEEAMIEEVQNEYQCKRGCRCPYCQGIQTACDALRKKVEMEGYDR